MAMTARALWTGVLLIITSMAAVIAAGPTPTAFIPAGIGLIMGILAIVGERNPAARKNAMHVALALAALGFLGSLRVLPDVPALLSGGSLERPVASLAQLAMLVFTGIFLFHGVRSFIDARRSSKQ